jgi:UDP-2-acetamido-2,6-beta-L-arabino-hexul-4-ose reductase
VSGDTVEYRVEGSHWQVVDIPPGYTHSIENVGPGELITLFWASEIYDPERPDTNVLPVQPTNETP